ncbi:1,2-phenylacetyl-CoA epoxidase subunit PaaC [Candidatus Uabimicrobium sp. HlEnr_7]|uniref:1,2-phenylacetyl-CoA epoxidase subunit PaaC n=1 Tax=Candidatus Uabimicrobium helgolandensis TaxID=3095367 RepID=UPI0035590A72
MKLEDLDISAKEALFEYLLFLGDSNLVLGHRLSEWCGHGPMLEEDIALANLALDCVGQSANFLKLAGEIEGKDRNEDHLAYLRDAIDFRNATITELPRGDFGFTIMRQFLVATYLYIIFKELRNSSFDDLKSIAQKSIKEVKYHIRHSSEWVLRLGDGTEESHKRIQKSLNELWRYTNELFVQMPQDQVLIEKNIIFDMDSSKKQWLEIIEQVLKEATLITPESNEYLYHNGREGKHTEYLGHMLAEMQTLPRSHPGAVW